MTHKLRDECVSKAVICCLNYEEVQEHFNPHLISVINSLLSSVVPV